MPTTSHVIVQSIIAFFVLLVLARIMGKRQLAQLNFFDYVAGITIGNIAASWSLDDTKDIHAISSMLIWTILSLIMSWIQRNSYRARLLLDGRPIVLIEDGVVLEKNVRKAFLSIEELMMLLRSKDIFKLADVQSAVMETNGTLTILKKRELRPLTPRDVEMPVAADPLPNVVIIDGNVMDTVLEKTGYSREWLLGQVMAQGAKDFRDVFLAQIESNGNVFVDLYQDTRHIPQIKQKPLVAASLKKAQADLEGFALATDDPDAKNLYREAAANLSDAFEKVRPFLKE